MLYTRSKAKKQTGNIYERVEKCRRTIKKERARKLDERKQERHIYSRTEGMQKEKFKSIKKADRKK